MRSLLENVRYSIGLVSCKEIVRRNVRYLIELRAVKEFVSRMCEVFDRSWEL